MNWVLNFEHLGPERFKIGQKRHEPRCHELGRFGPCLVRKNFQGSPSHRIFNHMHRALNKDKNKN